MQRCNIFSLDIPKGWRQTFKAALVVLCLLVPAKVWGAVLPNGAYLIQMADSDLAVGSRGTSLRERVSLRTDTTQGVWYIEHLGSDYYRINTKTRILVLDSQESKKYLGVPTIVFPWHGDKNQRWKIIRKGEFFALHNQRTGLALDLKDNNQSVGTAFQGYTPNSSRGQLFRLTPMGQGTKVKEFSNFPRNSKY